MELKEGIKAPEFNLEGDDGKFYTLESFSGKKLILYFYPKDNTPGCTTEALEFSAMIEEFKLKDAVVVGVSPDTIEKHKNFRTKHDLKVILLSDPDKKVAESYGAFGLKKLYGKESMGIIRSTFLINENGIIDKIYKNVRVKGHVEKVMCELK